jgi:hypothetical protein
MFQIKYAKCWTKIHFVGLKIHFVGVNCFVVGSKKFIYDTEQMNSKMRADRSAGNPHSGYSLAQLARFGFRVSKSFLFCLFWDYKTARDIR